MNKKLEKKKSPDMADLITITEAATLRGVSRAAIHELVQRGRLRSERMFGRVLLYRSEVESFEKEKPGPKSTSDEN
jgi:excisionase family DNA binding protein